MTANEKWNLIVKEFDGHKSAKEDIIQRLGESIFAEIFGYSRLNGEIDSHRKMRIGSTERVVPDIIIKKITNEKDLFIVELKQPLYSFEQKYKEQLLSYMKLFRIDIGILICDEIWLFMFDENDNEISMKIPFSLDSENGCRFIELFSKGTFDDKLVKQFIENDIAKREQQKNRSNRINEIRSDIQKRPLEEIIMSYYSSKYTSEEIKQALDGLTFIVKPNKPSTYRSDDPSTPLELKGYRQFLEKNNYSDTTISSYTSALKSIWNIENIDFVTLYHNIYEYAPMYDKDGCKNYLGQKGHGTWRNALNRLLDYYCSNKK